MDIGDYSGEHIWLRQSVRFTVGDQRRTLEIAIPVRPGASAEAIEGLLREADAGMAQLTRHLESQVAALAAGETVAPAPPATTPADTGGGAVESAPTSEPAPAPPAAAAARPAPTLAAVAPSVPSSAVAAPPPRARPEPAPEGRAAAVNRLEPARSAPAGVPPAPERPTPSPPAAQRPSAEAGLPLTRPTFLAETRALGLTPPQVMERLGVRTLDGLNLDEALEVLRRQLVRDGGGAPTGQPLAASARAESASVPPVPPPPPAAAPPTTPDQPPRAGAYFDEEDDFDVTFTSPEDETDEETLDLDSGAGSPSGAFEGEDEEEEESDELDLEDVPDFAAPASSPPRRQAAAAPEPSPRAAGGAGNARATYTVQQRARAREILAKLRAEPGGGAPSRMQLNAYTNIVVDQLDAAKAVALAQGVWGVAPQQLGTEQLNALIQWGKQDAFAEEAPAVLALLRAERATTTGAEEAAPTPRPTRAQGARRAEPGAGGVR
jgi:hypothetical protein